MAKSLSHHTSVLVVSFTICVYSEIKISGSTTNNRFISKVEAPLGSRVPHNPHYVLELHAMLVHNGLESTCCLLVARGQLMWL